MKMKKLFALLLAVCMLASMAACAPAEEQQGGDTAWVNPYAQYADDYDALSKAIYDDILGDFYTTYEAAKEATSIAERFALMAIAEAKLLQTGAMLPNTSNGGNYAISRVAPKTAPDVLWGNDSYRYHNVVVATEPITLEHRDEMKAKWAELKGTGEYEAWAENYLKEKGYTLKDSYTFAYSSDPSTWDVLATSKAVDSEAIINTYDGLYEYDCEGTLQPALAESYTVSDDGLTYTFKIRQGVKWVDSQGSVVGEVKADDFVAGMQHMMDAMGGLEYLLEGIIVNASEYIGGDITDFTQVGVEAVDDYTLEYTLVAPTSYFMTMLGYGVFAPMSRSYYVSKGGKFGADYNADDDAYTYGKTFSDIAYCGPYLVDNHTEANIISFVANDKYWNKDNVNMKAITWRYNDGKDALKAYNDAIAGTIDGAGLNASALVKAKEDGKFDGLAYVSACDATTFFSFYNLNRQAYANFNDASMAVSTKAKEQRERSVAAMYNQHFRLALCMGADRGAFNAQSVGEDLKLTSLRNSYTPGNFVSLPEEVTVKINGTDKTYPAGTQYGQIMQDQMDADGVKIKVWDPEAEGGIGSSDGYDGWYNPTNAKAELDKAIAELKEQGIEISAENPIVLDYPCFSGSVTYTNRAYAYKKSVEASLGGCVVVNLIPCPTADDIYAAGYDISLGSEANYDVYDMSGWGPDYGDPQTYLDTILPDYAGYMTMMLGLF